MCHKYCCARCAIAWCFLHGRAADMSCDVLLLCAVVWFVSSPSVLMSTDAFLLVLLVHLLFRYFLLYVANAALCTVLRGASRRGAVRYVQFIFWGGGSILPLPAVGAHTQGGVIVRWSKHLEAWGRQTRLP